MRDSYSPFDPSALGKSLILVGAFLVIIGAVIVFRERFPLLRYFGRLPGDISVERENFRFFFPVVTSILLSVILSFILWLLRK